MACGPVNKPASEYPTDMMLHFFQSLVEVVQENDDITPKVVFYQAGALAALPDKPLTLMQSFIRKVVGEWIVGNIGTIQDNEAVIRYIYEHKGDLGFDIIVSRPAMIKEKPSGTELKADHDNATNSPISFHDLAEWSLKAIQDESLYGTFPYVVPK